MRTVRMLSAALTLMFASSLLYAQTADDATEAAKKLNLRLIVTAGGKLKNGARVAVLPFPSTSGKLTEFSTYFSAELVSAIFKLKTIQPLERSQVDAITRELESSGDFGSGTAAGAAKQKGADAVLIGDVAMVGQTIVVNARVVSTANAETLTSANVKIRKTPDLERMLNSGSGTAPAKKAPSQANHGDAGNGSIVKSGKFRSFTIDITNCYREGDDIFFDIVVTNHASDPALFLLCRHVLKLYDRNGGAYDTTWVSIGTENSNNLGTHVGDKLPSEVPVKGKLRFRNIPSEVTTIKLLEFGASQDDGCVKVNFRDIPVAE